MNPFLPAAAAVGNAPFIWATAILLAIVSILHLRSCLVERPLLRYITKPFLMPAVILLHIAICGFSHPLVIAALVFGCIGDIFLMFISKRRANFVLGLLSFLIGHIFYIAAAFSAGLPQRAFGSPHGALLLIVCIAVMLAGGASVFAFLYSHIYKKLRLPCAAYILVLTSMAFTMIYCCLGGFRIATLLMALGGALFIVSDFILSCKVFGVFKGRRMNFTVMFTYIAAQICLAVGFALV